jgi:anthranilate synthase component II
MKILVLDNYDSFTYNLVHMIRELGFTPDIFRNDQISLADVKSYDKILLSPGPGIPEEAGILKSLIREYASSKSIFGVCLGHQAIGEVFGASLYNIPKVLHGVTSTIRVINPTEKIFKDVPVDVKVCHYHSWAVSDVGFPNELEITARNSDGLVMALAHRAYDVRGVQFHPESIMTEHGMAMMKNWLFDK